ncbi:MAG: heavy metal translocating P-type ATPase, partial [Desulfovibrio sp.]
VQEAQGSKAPVANLADRVSLYFVPVVMALAVVAGGAWFLSGAGAAFSLRIFVAVLVIACPCAMGLATPTSIMAGTGRGAQLGVLIRSGAALEAAARISTLVMDKTGTLTLGTPALTGIHLVDGASFSEKQVLVLAASVESVSEHPLASAVVQAAKVRGVTLGEVQEFESVPGLGVKAVVLEAGQERKVTVGRVSFVEQELGGAGQSLAESAQSVADQGETPLAVAVDGRTEAVLAVADQVRPEAGEVVARLKAMGITPVMLTGDTQATARAVASALNISRVTAEVLPQDKADVVAALAKDSQGVGMVGDGVNDGPALARADVGLAMGGGAHVAVEAGDMTLMRSDLRGVLTALQLSRAVLRNIKQNLFWAFGYNVLGIPIAAGVLAVFGGPTLSPMIAGAAMALSSVSVVSNALRLKRFTPTWTRAKQEAQPEAVRSSS